MSQVVLEVLTPEKQAFKSEVDSVYLQGSQGRLGILPMHTALIARLDFGMMTFAHGGKEENMLCGSGLVEVQDDKVTVLVKSAEMKNEIDIDRAKQAMARAKSRRDSKDNDINMIRAEASLYRAVQRLKFTGHI